MKTTTARDGAILDAVAAEAGWMEDLLVRLVEAPTVLGEEEAGQEIMEEAFADCGLEPRSVPLDAQALRDADGSSPFSWDVSGKRNVVADWRAGARDGRSLILNGHVDVVPPGERERWAGVDPFGGHADATDVWADPDAGIASLHLLSRRDTLTSTAAAASAVAAAAAADPPGGVRPRRPSGRRACGAVAARQVSGARRRAATGDPRRRRAR